jgi:hypothetical protein
MDWITRYFRRRCKEWYSQKWKPGCGYYDAAHHVVSETGGRD